MPRDPTLLTGTVIRLIPDRGFGFVRGLEGTEYFFHRSECVTSFDDLRVGTPVAFRPAESAKGPRADQVQVTGTR